MPRPNDGKVADNGRFILHDLGFGDELMGTFFAFDSLGQKLVLRRYKANLLNNGISSDGRYAACQTCSSSGSSDDAVLCVFDLERAAEIAKWRPESGSADFYEFPEGEAIRLGYRKLGTFSYTLTGEFIDREAWQDAQLAKGDCGGVLVLVERLIKTANSKPPSALAERLVKGIDRVIPTVPSTDSRTLAKALKLRGHCLSAQDNLQEAFDCYEKALKFDPNVGVKRLSAQIKKSLEARRY